MLGLKACIYATYQQMFNQVDLLLCSHWGRMFDFGFWMLVLPGVSMVAGRWRAGGAIRGLERGKWGVFNGKIYLGGA